MTQESFLPFRASTPPFFLLPFLLPALFLAVALSPASAREDRNRITGQPAFSGPVPLAPDIREDPAFARYSDTLKAMQAWTLKDLGKRYPAKFQAGPGYAESKVEYGTEVANALDTWEKAQKDRKPFLARVRRDGIAVSPDLRFRNFIQALESIWRMDMPVLFTSDALLYSIYLSYDQILIDLETGLFMAHLDEVIGRSKDRLEKVWERDDKRGPHVQDVRDLLETAEYLLWPARKPARGPSPGVARYLAAVRKQASAEVKIFGRDTTVDFSQFKPRGHYTKTPELGRYFQAMMWLSRADLAFHLDIQKEERNPGFTRAKKAAVVLWDCIREGGAYPRWKRMDAAVEFMVGTRDGMSMPQMDSLARILDMGAAPTYLARFDAAEEGRLDRAMAAAGFGRQDILSQFKAGHDGDTSLSPIFSFMPQRFVLDSYSFSRLVHPHVNGKAMPDPLEVAFLLGDNSAAADLPAYAAYPAHAVPALAAQRNLYDGIAPAAWGTNLYTGWLDFLRKLNGAEVNPKAAPAFKTVAWRAKMRNTQLASWAQLRHNTVLYVKQSYTMSIACDFPRAYVEPYPEFFAAVGAYARRGKTLFAGQDEKVTAYFGRLEDASGKLREAAERTASGRDLTASQVKWIKKALTTQVVGGGCGPNTRYDGWYHGLYHGRRGHPDQTANYTIADVHTKPSDDELGPAKVLHVATGPVEMAVAALPAGDCLAYFLAPVSSYYEVTATGTPLTRYSDPEWEKMVDDSQDGGYRPAWTSRFRGP